MSFRQSTQWPSFALLFRIVVIGVLAVLKKFLGPSVAGIIPMRFAAVDQKIGTDLLSSESC